VESPSWLSLHGRAADAAKAKALLRGPAHPGGAKYWAGGGDDDNDGDTMVDEEGNGGGFDSSGSEDSNGAGVALVGTDLVADAAASTGAGGTAGGGAVRTLAQASKGEGVAYT